MIVFASRTGNVRHIVNNISDYTVEIREGMIVNTPYFLFTYTDNLGEVPIAVKEFLETNHGMCKGVVVSGNSNFGHSYFCGAADKINKQYDIPIIKKIELRGFQKDFEEIKDKYNKLIKGEI